LDPHSPVLLLYPPLFSGRTASTEGAGPRRGMVKQRRPVSRLARSSAQSTSTRHSRPAESAVRVEPPVVRPATPVPAPPSAAAPQRRSTYFEAVAIYERGLEALQRHEYRQATELLESVLRQYPEEKELHERVRLYLNICQRQAAQREASPQTVDER